MNILHVNTTADTGGAAKVMYRLHQALNHQSHVSNIVARIKSKDIENVYTFQEVVNNRISTLDRFISQVAIRVDAWMGDPSFHIYSRYVIESDLFKQADVINLHNLHGYYFNYNLLPLISIHKPIVWTLHDMWALTGHCAYSYECDRWRTGCYQCPLFKDPYRQVVSPGPTRIDRTRHTWHKKKEIYQRSRLYIVTPSRWLYQSVKNSEMIESHFISHIPNGVDLNIYRPIDSADARQNFGIPQDTLVVLFISSPNLFKRKGLEFVLESLTRLSNKSKMLIFTVGLENLPSEYRNLVNHKGWGVINNEKEMALAYNAADLLVFPTLADNFPLVLLEAMACGIPSVSFDVGGVPEIVRHLQTGYLAKYRDIDDLINGIDILKNNSEMLEEMSINCRNFASQEYSLEMQASRYISLYEHAIQDHTKSIPSERS